MQSKWYTITWVSPPSDNPDKHGNHWYSVRFKEAEPIVQTLAKNEPTKGAVYGHVEKKEKQSKPGEHYYRFYRDQVPEGETPPQSSGGSSDLLELVKENNKMLKALTGGTETQEEPPVEAYEEDVPVGADELDDPVDLDSIPF